MKNNFYSHIIEIESLIIELDTLKLEKEEKAHLISLIESNLHHVILDTILCELSEKDKKLFLAHVFSENHDVTWEFLKKRIEDIENKIRKSAEELKKELHKDIKKTKAKNKE